MNEPFLLLMMFLLFVGGLCLLLSRR